MKAHHMSYGLLVVYDAWWREHYLTRFAQYARARATSTTDGRAPTLRHRVAWNCLNCVLELAYSCRLEAVESAERRIEIFGT